MCTLGEWVQNGVGSMLREESMAKNQVEQSKVEQSKVESGSYLIGWCKPTWLDGWRNRGII